MGEREQAELDRLHRMIRGHVPDAGQATSYCPPFSSKVLSQCPDQLTGFSISPGTLRFTADHPLPDQLVKRLLDLRMREIDERSDL